MPPDVNDATCRQCFAQCRLVDAPSTMKEGMVEVFSQLTNLIKGDAMSDQLFLGVAPQSDAGKEYMFYSMDDWIDVHQFICTEVDYDFPPHPHMDGESTEMLARHLNTLRNYGIAHAYFVLRLRAQSLREDEANRDDDCDLPSVVPWLDESSEEVERMVALVEGYIDFLRESGGCKVHGLNYEE